MKKRKTTQRTTNVGFRFSGSKTPKTKDIGELEDKYFGKKGTKKREEYDREVRIALYQLSFAVLSKDWNRTEDNHWDNY